MTLLGFTVPPGTLEHIQAHDELMVTQTHRFAWSLVRALRDNDVEVDLLSAAPVSDFPRNPQVLWPGEAFTHDGVRGQMLPFINLTVLKHLSRFVSCWVFALRQLQRSRPDWLLVHGVHSPFLWFAIMVAPRVGCRVGVVLTDPPGVVRAQEGRLRAFLKRIDIGVVTHALGRADAVVALTAPLAADFAQDVPALVVEGLSSAKWSVDSIRHDQEIPGVLTVVFAGGLIEEYGVGRLVQAFRSLPGDHLRLELYGRGPLERWLTEQAGQDPRIQGARLVPPEELGAIYGRATVLVQPRQIDQPFVPYSFPSKLVEYLASGTPVVSTRLPSIPHDYEPHVVWAEGDGPADLAQAMSRVLAWTEDDRSDFGQRASTFVRESRSTAAQGRRIVDFLDDVASR